MKFWLDDVLVYFPFKLLYNEQKEYMEGLKKVLDNGGKGIIEMPTGTGKTVSLLSFILSYQLAKPLQYRKLIYCTRTFAELEKTIEELKLVVDYIQAEFDEDENDRIRKMLEQRAAEESKKELENLQSEKVVKKRGWHDKKMLPKSRALTAKSILAIGMSARRALCIHPEVSKYTEREKVDAECFRRTARWHRIQNEVTFP
jgi:DNA excision repair protein ERCC-2